jgi:hypothetical protein
VNLPATITVTADHIEHGVNADCRACPIALAIAEAVTEPGIVVAVFQNDARIWRPIQGSSLHEPLYTADLPDAARQFIVAFDNDEHVEPFSFELTWEAAS